jgi:hypothetical protein
MLQPMSERSQHDCAVDKIKVSDNCIQFSHLTDEGCSGGDRLGCQNAGGNGSQQKLTNPFLSQNNKEGQHCKCTCRWGASCETLSTKPISLTFGEVLQAVVSTAVCDMWREEALLALGSTTEQNLGLTAACLC